MACDRGVTVLVETVFIDVGQDVAELVVARVECWPGRAAVQRHLVRLLDLLGTGEDAAGRDPHLGEGVVVGATVERDRLVGEALAVPVVLEHLLDRCRSRSGPATPWSLPSPS